MHKEEINKMLQLQLEDNTKKRTLNSKGLNNTIEKATVQRRSQIEIYEWLKSKNNI